MKPALLLLLLAMAVPVSVAQTQPAKAEQANTATGEKQPTHPAPAPSTQARAAQTAVPRGGNAALEKVLDSMDRAAANFHSAQADFTQEQYESVVRETSTQGGAIYIRRAGKDLEMAAEITQPSDEQKSVLFTDSKVQLYQPKIDQVTVYNAGKNREAFQSFLVLGFGAGGHDLYKQFDVKYEGAETVQGVNAAKLELTPKSQRVRNMFNPIVLWIDPARGVSVQQQFFEPGSGNYRTAKYSNIKINHKLPDDVFKLKTSGRTKFVTAGM